MISFMYGLSLLESVRGTVAAIYVRLDGTGISFTADMVIQLCMLYVHPVLYIVRYCTRIYQSSTSRRRFVVLPSSRGRSAVRLLSQGRAFATTYNSTHRSLA